MSGLRSYRQIEGWRGCNRVQVNQAMPEIQQPWLVSFLPPSPTLRRVALAVSTFLLVAFVITILFAEVMLPRLNIYIPLVATVMFLNDAITASLLLVQFSIARSRTLLVLANGYLFTALVAAVYGLVWPGAFHPTGLFGAGPETPPWLYLVWHAGLPTSVIVYALLKSKEYETPPVTRDSVRTFIAASITCNIVIVCGLTWFVTRFHDVLPILVTSVDRASGVSHFGTGAVLIVSIGALVLQWRGRLRSMLDLWLSVVTLAWLLGSIMLTAIGARYDVAWYATPGFLVVSAIPVLLVLVSESFMLHAKFDLKLLLELQRREAEVRRLVDANILGICLWSLEGAIVGANEAFLRIVQYGREDLVSGRVRWTDLTPAEWRERDERALAELNATGTFQPFEKEYFRKDGSRVPVLIGGALFQEGGNEGVAFVLDLSEQKRAEAALRSSEAYLAEAQRLSQTGSWAWSPDQDIRYWSEECYRVLSFDPQDGLPRFEQFFQRLHPDDQPVFRELIQTAIREKAEWQADYRIVHPDGAARDIHVVGHPVLNTSGHLVEFVGTVIDITERKRAEEELRRSEMELRQMLDFTPQLVAVFGPNREHLHINRIGLDYLGRRQGTDHALVCCIHRY